VRQENLRNQAKFAREMSNALGVVEGQREEPLRSRRESAVPEDLDGLRPFVQCCHMAERAQAFLRPPAPRLAAAVHKPGLIVLPHAEAALPAFPANTIVATPAVLDLLLATQKPDLWLTYGPTLGELGFAPPPRRAWLEWCQRQCSGERLRLPGFGETGPIDRAGRLAAARAVLESLKQGQSPVAAACQTAASPNLRSYYSKDYDRLAERAAELRARVRGMMLAAPFDQ
jgi:hypothetical protein